MRKLAVRTIALALLTALPFASGCGNFFVYPGSTTTGTGTATSTTSFAYVANATTLTLAGFALASGSLVAVTGSPYSLPLSPTSAVVTPANTFLYVGCLGAIYGYSIGSTGQLTPLSSGSAVAVATAISMDVSPDGQLALHPRCQRHHHRRIRHQHHHRSTHRRHRSKLRCYRRHSPPTSGQSLPQRGLRLRRHGHWRRHRLHLQHHDRSPHPDPIPRRLRHHQRQRPGHRQHLDPSLHRPQRRRQRRSRLHRRSQRCPHLPHRLPLRRRSNPPTPS